MLDRRKIATLEIITGKGIHSENNRAKIKPEVESLLRSQGYPYRDTNGGYLVSPKAGSKAAGQGAASSGGFFASLARLFCCCLPGFGGGAKASNAV